MNKTASGWTVVNAEAPILTFAYSFGAGTANALAVGCSGGIVVVSPPCNAADAVVEELQREFGPVRALVAPNAFHHMGLAAWHARCPDAELYAPAQSIARVQRQSGLHGIRPAAEFGAIAGPRLQLVDMPHYKTGELLVRIDTNRGLVWYVTDIIMNMPSLPGHPLVRLLFKLSGSAPGLRFNNIAPLFMVKNKAALKRWLAAEAGAKPPRWLIPAHGDIADLAADGEATQRLFAIS